MRWISAGPSAPCLCSIPQNKKPSEAPSPGIPQLPKSVKCSCDRPKSGGRPPVGKERISFRSPDPGRQFSYTVFNPHSNLGESPFHGCGRSNLKSLGNVSVVTAGQPQSQAGPALSVPKALFCRTLQALPSRSSIGLSESPAISRQPTSIPSFALPPSLNRPLVGSAFLGQARLSPAAGPCT